MSVILTPINLTKHIQHAWDQVSGLTFDQALTKLAKFPILLEIKALYENSQILGQVTNKSNRLISLIVDENGKELATVSGYRSEDTNPHIRQQIRIQYEAVRRIVFVKGTPVPLRNATQVPPFRRKGG